MKTYTVDQLCFNLGFEGDKATRAQVNAVANLLVRLGVLTVEESQKTEGKRGKPAKQYSFTGKDANVSEIFGFDSSQKTVDTALMDSVDPNAF